MHTQLAQIASALTKHTGATFADTVKNLMGLTSSLVVLLGGVAVAVFFYGIVKFVKSTGDQKGHQDGYKMMVWGIVALFIFFSLGAIINLMCNSFFSTSSCTANSANDTGAPNMPAPPVQTA